ncbi:hypothetical protein [Cylindrospermopsis curvispora]|uniref:Uncharacterized protein n=1 Tax=Cylindrospermopsis curvispora GIHE-G1 TaxID=2666332 RepID=A0A7H0EYN0_9CYAN|nr:hypothetical protein [Cylindrospermopsis curvispora]QNP28896.1 hypothetical protein IAR63_13645 [Cylindrospermopsis curvispora GIHE-G1]
MSDHEALPTGDCIAFPTGDCEALPVGDRFPPVRRIHIQAHFIFTSRSVKD